MGHLSKYLSTRLCLEPTKFETSEIKPLVSAITNGSSNTNGTTANGSTTKSENEFDFQFYINSTQRHHDTTTSSTANASTSSSYSNDNFTLLPHNMPLEQIMEKYWKLNKPLEMLYIYSPLNKTL